jgi:hypothetical protein
MSSVAGDAEIQAIEQVIGALDPLDQEARARVLDYTFKRLGMEERPSAQLSEPSPAPVSDAPTSEPIVSSPSPRHDIRSLREQKQPKSANEMAAVVAYYLADLAPPDERKKEIGTADIEKYFKQAGHPLPQAIEKTLRNAAHAGYFDSAARGLYSLNPVGHNLVAHGLPRAGASAKPGSRKKKKGSSSTSKSKQKAARSKSGRARRLKK